MSLAIPALPGGAYAIDADVLDAPGRREILGSFDVEGPQLAVLPAAQQVCRDPGWPRTTGPPFMSAPGGSRERRLMPNAWRTGRTSGPYYRENRTVDAAADVDDESVCDAVVHAAAALRIEPNHHGCRYILAGG